MKSNFKYLILILLVSLMACQRVSNHKYVKQVNVLIEKVDSLQNLVQPDSLKGYKTIKSEIDSTMVKLESIWAVADTLNPEFFQNYSLYTNAGRMISRVFRKGLPNIYTEIELSEKQLKNLKHDIKKGLISPSDSIEFYLNTERMAVESIEHQIELNLTNLESQAEAFTKSKPYIEQLLKDQNRVK